MNALAFCDTETTGLDPDRNEVWEVALLLRRPDRSDEERVWQLPVNLGRADSIALTIGRFYERVEEWGDEDEMLDEFAAEFAALTHGAHLVGAVPSFDDAFLKRLLRSRRACPGWHYHLVDVEALAAGRLGLPPPWNSEALSLAVGVDPAHFDRHTAMGDVKWAAAIYDAVMAEPVSS